MNNAIVSNLEMIIRGETSQTVKDKYHMLSLKCGI